MAGMNRAQLVLARFDAAEYRLCRGLNRAAEWTWLRELMRVASRLGDGLLWYLLLAALPLLYGAAAIRPALIMLATGLTGLLIYRRLKSTLVRERPFIRYPGITPEMPPLDRFSFPSGHTLHAVSFTCQAVAHFPALGAGARGFAHRALARRAGAPLPDGRDRGGGHRRAARGLRAGAGLG
jgi:undecaprenyl-diphosphatase